ncbi:uncharacterized protein LOC110233779 [Rhizophagus irregularis DAOM 181602=DAOM 197198]|nr:uncharacterized protein LOC110233779 [Rhizophagus irregularis DAOM 181602=DAOM 197198]
MTRKRSLSSILNEKSDSRPHAIPSSRIQRTRSVSNIIDEESLNQSYPTSSRIGRLVACNCSECNGRLVDPCTKTIHEINQDSEDDDSERTEVHLPDEAELPSDEPYESASISDEPRMRELEAELPRDIVDDKSSESSEYTMEEDANIDDRNESSDNEPSNDDEYHEIFEDYSCPPFEPFQDSDTEQSINNRHWINRPTFDNILTDIYDGEVWKTFKETTDESSNNFFRSDVADSHLGLILNLDWFQPFDGKIHSTGVIYAAISNLPRDVRFKRNNILILGLLPGPDEVSLHKINHYLVPIIDELKSLWEGVTLNKTYECQEGKRIRAALILVSCDIPAARKICGHISALVSCHRCEKKVNYKNRQHNFAGINEMDEWFTCHDSAQHRQDAIGWRRCNSDAARKRFVKQTGVRWSKLLRLPYFDPIQFITINPMHCLFLGIAKWIVRRLWIENGVLTTHILKTVQKKIDEFKVPADLGRIPGKVDCGDGFSNFTADQWRIFFTIYATVSLWEHLSENDQKILMNFVRICSISVSRIVEVDFIREAHQKLINLVKLIEENYGRDKITPNLHLSLHLCECSLDYGPLYTFWYFSFECMNGMLGIIF